MESQVQECIVTNSKVQVSQYHQYVVLSRVVLVPSFGLLNKNGPRRHYEQTFVPRRPMGFSSSEYMQNYLHTTSMLKMEKQ